MPRHSYFLSTDKRGELHHVRAISNHLRDEYPETDLGNTTDSFAELIYIILSVRTAEVCYQRAFQSLETHLKGNWNSIFELSEIELSKIIADGGLADKKAVQILEIARTLDDGSGQIDMSSIEALPTSEVVDRLCEFRGIGVKVAKCIAMYAMQKEAFPIDIHCARIGGRIGWFETRTRYTRNYADLIEDAIPSSRRYRLHVDLIQHGREVCKAKTPECDRCCIAEFCEQGKASSLLLDEIF